MEKQVNISDVIRLIETHQKQQCIFFDDYKAKNPNDKTVNLAHGAVLSELASLLYDLKKL